MSFARKQREVSANFSDHGKMLPMGLKRVFFTGSILCSFKMLLPWKVYNIVEFPAGNGDLEPALHLISHLSSKYTIFFYH